MKKTVLWVIFVPVFILMGLASYAAMTKEPISEANLSDVKGKWEGWRTGRVGQNLRTELEIYGDTLPVKGKFTLHDVMKQKRSTTETVEFGGGQIKDGNLYIEKGQNYWELSLHKGDGKMKLEGDFYGGGTKGTMTFNKK